MKLCLPFVYLLRTEGQCAMLLFQCTLWFVIREIHVYVQSTFLAVVIEALTDGMLVTGKKSQKFDFGSYSKMDVVDKNDGAIIFSHHLH